MSTSVEFADDIALSAKFARRGELWTYFLQELHDNIALLMEF